METSADSSLARWTVPQCPFSIEYSTHVLEEIRLSVVDAFFLLPRGGAEIGGVLLGKYKNGQLWILESAALECEHASGPSFTLSPNDHRRLSELLAAHRQDAGGLTAVGWYHSHTRSEVFLSDADVEIHKRYFPEAWQVALVIKPHAFLPARAGFFFREADGTIRSESSYQEFTLEPTSVKVPHSPPRLPDDAAGARAVARKVLNAMPAFDAAPGPQSVSEPAGPPPAPVPAETGSPGRREEAADVAPPKFLQAPPPTPRRWPIYALALGGGLALGATAYQTRGIWLPHRTAPAPATAAPPSVGLSSFDTDGQLQVRWDRNSPTIQSATDAILIIRDGDTPFAVQLDRPHLQAGSFTYGRQGEHIDITMSVHIPDGQTVREASTYVGKLPDRKPAPEDPGIRKQRDELARQAAQLSNDLKAQRARTKRLEKSLEEVRTQMRQQQRKRMNNQEPDR